MDNFWQINNEIDDNLTAYEVFTGTELWKSYNRYMLNEMPDWDLVLEFLLLAHWICVGKMLHKISVVGIVTSYVDMGSWGICKFVSKTG